MTRIGVVVNPTAGNGRGDREGRRALTLLEDHGHNVIDLTANSFDEAIVKVRQGIVDGLDALVVVGGDGMVHLGVNLIAETSLPLGIIAVGTGNDIPRSIGLPVHDVAASVDIIERGILTGGDAYDVVSVGDPDHTVRERYLGVLSAGFDAAVNEKANSLTWPRGHMRYLRAVMSELSGMKPYDYKVTIDDKQIWRGSGTLVSVANTSSIGGGLRIAPMAKPNDGYLDVLLVTGVRTSELVKVFPKIYRGTHVGHPAATFLKAKKILLEPGDGLGRATRVPPAAYADGERIGPLPLICEIEESAIRIFSPKSASSKVVKVAS